MRKLPKNFHGGVPTPKFVGMDAHDLEAEAQGQARRAFREAWSPENSPVGRRLAKNQRKADRGAAIAGCVRVKAFTKDHKAVCALYGVNPKNI